MDISYYGEADSCSHGQEMHCILRKHKVNRGLHTSPFLESQLSTIHSITPYFLTILLSIVFPHVPLSYKWTKPLLRLLLALMTETVNIFETSVNFYETVRCNVSEDRHLYTRHCENLKFYKIVIICCDTKANKVTIS